MPHDEDEATYSDEEADFTLANGNVVEKYKLAGTFCNNALKDILAAVKEGVTPLALAEIGDNRVMEQTEKVFNKKGAEKVEKGLAFPTCINVNRVAAHFAPTEEEKGEPLKNGDVVKIDLGCHLDGYCAVVAHTVVVQDDLSTEVPASVQSNVVAAAAAAVEAVTHMFRPGAKNGDITNVVEQIAKDYDVTPVEGVLSHEMKRYIIDNVDCIAMRNLPEQHVLPLELEENQVWSLDIVFSSAPASSKETGKLRQEDLRTNVYKRSLDEYQLKLKASREVFSTIERKFQTFPFSMRHLDPKKGRLCISECLKHDLVSPYPVLMSKSDETVAHFKSTILIRSSEIERVTGIPAQKIATEKKIVDKDVLEACSRSLVLKKKKKNNKKKKGDKKEEETKE